MRRSAVTAADAGGCVEQRTQTTGNSDVWEIGILRLKFCLYYTHTMQNAHRMEICARIYDNRVTPARSRLRNRYKFLLKAT
jgi:hypothetical protein